MIKFYAIFIFEIRLNKDMYTYILWGVVFLMMSF